MEQPWSRYYGQSSANYNQHSSSFGRRSNNPTYVHHHSYDRRDRPDFGPPSEHEFDAEPVEKDAAFYHTGERYYYDPPDGSTPVASLHEKPLGATHVVLEHKNKKSSFCMWLMTALLILVSVILVICIILFFIFARSYTQLKSSSSDLLGRQLQAAYIQPKFDHVVTPSFVLTAVITKRKICLLDATGSGTYDENRLLFNKEHIKGAQWFDFTNVTNEQPTKLKELVHPLVFQSYVRELGIDKDCHVIFYDRGDDEAFSIKWATFGYWLFRVFGHSKVSIMQGGLRQWRKLQQANAEYEIESGTSPAPAGSGNFEAQWSSQYIVTFPDIVANFETGNTRETREYLLIDARTPEEFKGIKWDKLAIGGGHIKDAISIPMAAVYDDEAVAFKNKTELVEFFTSSNVSYSQPAIVYCSTSVRASVVWFAMQMINYPSRVYDGSWVEWSIRAPEELKVILTTKKQKAAT
uniref:Rhodanese domain-containing protein n=1 Tax=Plectus sambesii TaxID=2011161 RepID=A0A914W5E9_9BILA